MFTMFLMDTSFYIDYTHSRLLLKRALPWVELFAA